MAGTVNPVCRSCYKGFMPVVHHLRSLAAGGHAFHQHCIQHLFASCWQEEMFYSPDSKAIVRRLRCPPVVHSCHCGQILKELRQEVKQLKGRIDRTCNLGSWYQRRRRRETVRRLHGLVMRFKSKVMRPNHLLDGCKNVIKEVPLEEYSCHKPLIGDDFGIANLCDKKNIKVSDKLAMGSIEIKRQGNIAGNVGISNRCKCYKIPSVKPVNLAHTKVNINRSDNSKAEALGANLSLISIGTTLGHIGGNVDIFNRWNKIHAAEHVMLRPSKRILEGPETTNGEVTSRNKPALGSTETVELSPGKDNTKGSDNLKAEANLVTELSLIPVGTTMGRCNIEGNAGFSYRWGKIQRSETLHLSPRKRNTKGSDNLKAEVNLGSELSLGPTGTTMRQCISGGNVTISNGCNQIPSVKPVKLSPSKRSIKGLDKSKVDVTSGPEIAFGSIGTTIGQCNSGHSVSMPNRCSKRQFEESANSGSSKRSKNSFDNLKADAAAGAECSSGSICTTMAQCNGSDDPYSVGSCLKILNGMEEVDPRLYIEAQELFQNSSWRKVFVSLKSAKRLHWLISMLPGV